MFNVSLEACYHAIFQYYFMPLFDSRQRRHDKKSGERDEKRTEVLS